MCRGKNEELLTNKKQVLARWKEHFEEHLNEGSESEQPTESWRNIKGAEIPENNKADGANSIAAKLLKNGGPNLVDALHEVI
jgi:hypothetical protein